VKILLHVCCAECTIGPYQQLAREGHEVTGFFYNPNIHPFIEFRRRKKALKVLQERLPIPVLYREEYGLEEYLDAVAWRSADRCADCYSLRLGATARTASREDFDAFTTTLLGSTHQDHDLIRRIGEECAAAAGVAFHVADWRAAAQEAHRRAKAMNLYCQNYCGCIFSEWERFRDTSLHRYRGNGPADGR
jgi:predicted adenine nucleotide alpha hydrolase (AANH) superfamily ATPase